MANVTEAPRAISTEKWNQFTTSIQTSLLLLDPKDNPDIVKACENVGINEGQLYETWEMLGVIFDACYNDVFPPQNSNSNVE